MSSIKQLIAFLSAISLTACATANKSKPSSHLEIDETKLRTRLGAAGISLETLKKQVQAEIDYQRSIGALPTKNAPKTY